MPEPKTIPAQASSRHSTIRALIEASIARKPLQGSKEAAQSVYAFADPAFDKYLIRVSDFSRSNLKHTTSLSPAQYLFNGPQIGSPLMEGITDKKQRRNTISIVLKQPGKSLFSLQTDKGFKRAALLLAESPPDAIEQLFRTAAFLGLHDKTVSKGPSPYRQIDANLSNIIRSDDGRLTFIDQMSYEDIGEQKNDNYLNTYKAIGSIDYLCEELLGIAEDGLERHGHKLDSETLAMRQLEERILAASKATTEIIKNVQYNRYPDPNKAWEYLKSALSDPGMEWRGLEDAPTHSPVFKQVHSVSAKSLNMDKASPQQLLDMLNKLHGTTLPRAR